MKEHLLLNLRQTIPWKKLRARTILSLVFFTLFSLFTQEISAQIPRLNFELENSTLVDALKKISLATGLDFFYNSGQISTSNKRVTVKFDNAPLEQALDAVLKDTQFMYRIEDNTIIITQRPNVTTYTDNRITIQGVVFDKKSGKPLPGATVILKGTVLGTSTDAQGKFSLTLHRSKDMTLTITFLGYKSKDISIIGNDDITVELEEEEATIDDVIVTGYYTRDKESFTGSAISVNQEDLRKVSAGNILSALQVFDPSFRIRENTEAGSNPNTPPNIRIRGNSGFGTEGFSEAALRNDPNLPTFILDGYEVSLEKIFDLNIDRIENITILKDASATAIYGSRAANGVIVVTTVAPKPGELRISYNLNLSITAPDLSDYNLLNARDKLQAELDAGLYEIDDLYTEQLLRKDYSERLERVQKGVDTYWLSQPLHVPVGHKHSLYAEGGDRNIRYGLDVSYQGNPGVMKKSKRDRFGLGFLISYNLNDRLLFRNKISIDKVNSKESPYGTFRDYALANPYEQIYDDNGNLIESYQPNVATTNRFLNPLYEAQLNHKDETTYTEWTDNFDFDWFINDHFRFRSRISYSERNDKQDKFTDPASAVYNKYEYQEGEGILKRGSAYSYQERSSNLDLNAVLNYNQHFEKHYINAVLGGNLIESHYKNESYTVIGFPSGNMDYISFGKEFLEERPDGEEGLSRLAGAFMNLNYTWNNIYLLDLSGRLDGSSKFGTDKRYAPFWSAGIGWNIHNEKFFTKARKVVNHLKITASTGETGKASFQAYEAQNVYQYYRGQWYAAGMGVLMHQMGNPSLQWEKTRMFDTNFEVQFYEGRFSAILNYYTKRTKDLLADISLPLSSGFESYRDNLGELENKGYEISLRGFIVRKSDLVVNVYGSLAHNSNTIKQISNSLQSYNDMVDREQDEYEVGWGETMVTAKPIVQFKEGQSTTAIYAVRSLGINPMTGREVFIDHNGNLTYDWSASNKVVCGDTEPKVSGTFGMNATWKGFTLNMSFLYQMGGQTYNQTLVDRIENANLNWNVDKRVFEGRWRKPGDNTFFKDITDRNRTEVTSRFVQDENILQFKSLYLSYEAPGKWSKKFGMERLRLNFQMEDIFRISSVKQERGLDYPFARVFNFGLQVQF